MTTTKAIEADLAPHPLNAIYWSMVVGALYTLAISLGVQLVYPSLADILSGEAENAAHQLWMFSALIQFAVLIRITGWAMKTTGSPFAGEFHTSSNWLAIGAMIGPVVLIGSGVVIGTLFGGGDPDWAYSDTSSSDFFSKANISLIMVVYVVVLAPLVEEIGFRGIALGCLLGRGTDPYLAVLITSIGFAALHLQYSPLGLLTVLITGVFFGWLRIASGTVSVPIVAHMAANAMSVWLLSLSPDVV
ncbi:MAG: type II CAAX endopeptidase family protein [Pseudomonadota bacterium]